MQRISYFNHFRLTFGNLEPDWISVLPDTGYGVLFMEVDQYIPGNVLYVEGSAIKTLNLQTNETWLIAGDIEIRGYRNGYGGSVRFNIPSSFHQRNSTELIILDTRNGCIRTVSQKTNATSNLAGICTETGDVDGPFNIARVGAPEKFAEIRPGVLAFTDFMCNCIKVLDLVNARVTTLAIVGEPVFGLAKKPGTEDLIFTVNGGLGKVNSCSGNVAFLTTTIYTGYRDGPLTESSHTSAVFSLRPETLLFLNQDIMLVTGFRTHLIRVVNFASEFVTSICDPSLDGNLTLSGDIETCHISYPR